MRQIAAKAVKYLSTVVENKREDPKHRVASARALLRYHQWREDREGMPAARAFLALFGKDPVAALDWLKQNGPAIETRLLELTNPARTSESSAQSHSESEVDAPRAEQGQQGEGDG